MKNTKVMIVFVLLSGIIIGTCMGATADTIIKDVTVQINSSINYKLNGNEFIPKNVDGSKMDTLIYNGRSYVPLRAIADAFSVAVDWDGTNSTIIMGEREGKGVSLLDLKPNYENSLFSGVFITPTVDKSALIFKGDKEVNFSFGFDSESYKEYGSRISVSLEKKFQTLRFYAWTTEASGRIIIKDNDKHIELKRIDIGKNTLTEIEVDVGGINNLYIEYGGYQETKFVIAEPYLN